MPEIDLHDLEIIDARRRALDRVAEPRQGDYVRFAGGKTQRISHVYGKGWGKDMQGVQTSAGGHWYLGDGYVSFSGSLDPMVPMHTLHRTAERRPGGVWIFHHDHHTAHNGVDFEIPFRVYTTTQWDPRGREYGPLGRESGRSGRADLEEAAAGSRYSRQHQLEREVGEVARRDQAHRRLEASLRGRSRRKLLGRTGDRAARRRGLR